MDEIIIEIGNTLRKNNYPADSWADMTIELAQIMIEFCEKGHVITSDYALDILINRLEQPLARELPFDTAKSGSLGHSTKSKSLAKTNLGQTNREVYEYLKSHPRSSRNEIQKATGLRLSTVTGACTPLIDMGYIKVVGKVYDKETKRFVETLSIKE